MRLTIFAYASMMVIAGSSIAQEVVPPGGGSGPRMIRRAPAPPPQRSGERADVEMRLVNGMPTIAAMVNGRGPYRFGVDTGAPGYLRVTSALATALALRPVGQALARDPSGLGPANPVPIYQVESLAFGELRFSAISTNEISLGGRLAELDGIIGIGFFQELLLTYDYPGGRLVAAPGALPPANGADVIDATVERGLISIPVRIGDTVHQIHLDTGNTRHPMFMPAAAIATLPTRGMPRDIGVARTINREVPLQEIDLSAPVRAGAARLAVTAVAFPSIAAVGNIGSLALRESVLTVDQHNRRVRIVPGGN